MSELAQSEASMQLLTTAEMGEIHRLLLCLNGLKHVSMSSFDVIDANGDVVGKISVSEGTEWAFRFPAPEWEATP